MTPRFQRIVLQRTAKLLDLGLVASSFLAALAIASGSYTILSFADVLAMRIQIFNLLFFASYVGVCAVTFAKCGFYISHRLSHWRRRVREIFTAVTLITAVLFALRSPFDFAFASNHFLFFFWLFSLVVLLIVRVFGYHVLQCMRLRGRNLRSIVIVGEGMDARPWLTGSRKSRRLATVSFKSLTRRRANMQDSPIIEQLNSVIANKSVDEVLVALPIDKYGPLVQAIVRQCEEQGIIVRVRTEMSTLHIAKSYVDDLHGVPVVTIQSGPQDGWQLVVKRLIDIVVSAGLLIALAPLLVVVSLLIKFESSGPVLFTQERVGLQQATFQDIKISHHGRRGPISSSTRWNTLMKPKDRFSKLKTIRGSPGSASSYDDSVSMNCRSSSTCSKAI